MDAQQHLDGHTFLYIHSEIKSEYLESSKSPRADKVKYRNSK